MMNNSKIITNTSKSIMSDYKSIKGYKTLKPKIIEFNEDYSSSTMLARFLNKIKPIEGGIIIFQMTCWKEFPADRDNAINTGKIWSTAFSKKKTHKNVTVNVYFDIENRTITFKVKPYNIKSIEIENKNIDQVKDQIKNDTSSLIIDNSVTNSVTNIYTITNCEDYPLFDDFKNASRDLAINIETMINNLQDGVFENKYCVIVFMKKTGINITIKRKVILNTCDDVLVATTPEKNTENVATFENEDINITVPVPVAENITTPIVENTV
jgi:hypothetical protein